VEGSTTESLDEVRPGSRCVGSSRRRSLRLGLTICLGFATAEVIGLVAYYFVERTATNVTPRGTSSPINTVEVNRLRFYAPGIERPPVLAAREARLSDEEKIIGVEVEGRFRAYRISAMLDRFHHIVNDMIDERPITVTYCSLRDTAAGFTSGRLGTPLPISQGGLWDGRMVICIGEAEYSQETLEPFKQSLPVPAFPYEPTPLVRTSWKNWREQHPETDVYEGPPGRDQGSAGKGVSKGKTTPIS
jgi:Protein of unknown function (DUF3179)